MKIMIRDVELIHQVYGLRFMANQRHFTESTKIFFKTTSSSVMIGFRVE